MLVREIVSVNDCMCVCVSACLSVCLCACWGRERVSICERERKKKLILCALIAKSHLFDGGSPKK